MARNLASIPPAVEPGVYVASHRIDTKGRSGRAEPVVFISRIGSDVVFQTLLADGVFMTLVLVC